MYIKWYVYGQRLYNFVKKKQNFAYKFKQFSTEDLRDKLLSYSNEENVERIGTENKKHILELLSEDVIINKFNNIMNSKTWVTVI